LKRRRVVVKRRFMGEAEAGLLGNEERHTAGSTQL
jgi:hypothetical protein